VILGPEKEQPQLARAQLPFEHLSFEEVLQSVEFPNLDNHHNEDDPFAPMVAGNEVQRMLDWLREKKKVRKIIRLNVRDSLHHPHSEEVIETAIAPFDIESLDWKRLDLSIDSIFLAAPNVRELRLYSSGSQAALRHWIGSEGVRKLKEVSLVPYGGFSPILESSLMYGTATSSKDLLSSS
jgi:hypothetical protein